MTQQSSSVAFQDDFTNSHGGSCFFVAVDPNFTSDVGHSHFLEARTEADNIPLLLH